MMDVHIDGVGIRPGDVLHFAADHQTITGAAAADVLRHMDWAAFHADVPGAGEALDALARMLDQMTPTARSRAVHRALPPARGRQALVACGFPSVRESTTTTRAALDELTTTIPAWQEAHPRGQKRT